MKNSWKAECIDGCTSDWVIGDIIEVVDGVVIDSEYHCFGGERSSIYGSFESWSDYSDAKWKLMPEKEITKDVTNPDYYKSQCSLECIEAMQMAFGTDAVYWFCICNAWKYMWRWENKNGEVDISKSRWYVEKAKELESFDKCAVANIDTVLKQIEKKIKKD